MHLYVHVYTVYTIMDGGFLRLVIIIIIERPRGFFRFIITERIFLFVYACLSIRLHLHNVMTAAIVYNTIFKFVNSFMSSFIFWI